MFDWKDFELLISNIQRQLSPNADIKHNDHVLGLSGDNRQLDITVRQKIGLAEVFIVFECKKHSRPIAKEIVESFNTKLNDVKASQGILVSTSGFTQGAKNSSALLGIKLLTQREANVADWSNLLGKDSWAGFILIDVKDYSVTGVSQEIGNIEINKESYVYDSQGNRYSDLESILYPALKHIANQGKPVGKFNSKFILEKNIYIKHLNEIKPIEHLEITGNKSAYMVPVNLELAAGIIVEDSLNETDEFAEVFSQSIDWRSKLQNSPGRVISEEEYDQMFSNPIGTPLSLDLDNTKKFLRISFTKQNNGT